MSLTPEQVAQQWLSPVLADGEMIGVAFGYDRIVKEWKPEQADELEAVGRIMIELAEQLRALGGESG